MTGHLSPDELADLDAGVLEHQAARRARAHLGGCATCTTALAAFADVRATLARVGARTPDAVPGDVAARLDAALAAEAARRRGATSVAGPVGLHPVVRQPANRRERGLRPRGPGRRQHSTRLGVRLLAAATVVGALGGVGVLLSSSNQQAQPSSAAGMAAPTPAASAAAGSASAAAGAAAAAGPAAGPPPASPPLGAAQAPDAAAAESLPPARRLASGAGPATPSVIASGRDYSPADLAAAPGVLATGGAAAARLAGDAERLRDPAALRDCLTGVGAPGVPLGVDLARYRGAPAAVLVLTVPSDPRQRDVRVVRPGCTAADAQQVSAQLVPVG